MSSRLAELPKTLSYLLRHPIHRGHKLAALGRFLAWQVGSRLAPGPVAVEMVPGARLLVRPGMPGATGAVYFGLHEFEDMAFVLHLLRPGDLFVDCGANVGSYTVLAAAGAGAHCLAFEPIAQAADDLVVNLGLNGVHEKVTLRRAGVGATAGRLRMTTALDTMNHVTRDDEAAPEGTLWVPVETLDSHLANEARPFVVKIDVEGFELSVLRGAKQCLALPNALAVVAEVNDASRAYGSSPEEFDQQIRTLGFAPVSYDPFTRRLEGLGGLNPRTNNTIYVKDRALVAGRLAAAPLRRVLDAVL